MILSLSRGYEPEEILSTQFTGLESLTLFPMAAAWCGSRVQKLSRDGCADILGGT